MKLIRRLGEAIARVFECDKISVRPDVANRARNFRR